MVKVTKYSIRVFFILGNSHKCKSCEKQENWIFYLKLQTQEDKYNCVSFLPEKQQLLKNISQERAQNIGAVIKRYRGDKNLTINDYSSVKKQKLDFEERKVKLSY